MLCGSLQPTWQAWVGLQVHVCDTTVTPVSEDDESVIFRMMITAYDAL